MKCGMVNLTETTKGSPAGGDLGLEASYSRPAAQLFRSMYDTGGMGYMTSFVGTGRLGLSGGVGMGFLYVNNVVYGIRKEGSINSGPTLQWSPPDPDYINGARHWLSKK